MPSGGQTGETVEVAKEDVSANAEFIESADSLTLHSQLGSFRNFPISPSGEYEDFFKRPFELYQFDINSTNGNNTRYAVEWPSDNLPPVYAAKLRGVYAFRADITARFIVSSTNMQSGIYRFCAFPMYGNLDHRYWTCTVQGTNYLPHVDVDLSCTRRAELKLPWVFPINAITTTTVPLWRLFVIPIIPIATGTANSDASCSIWIIHDKFETYGSSSRATFQSGVMDKEEKKNGAVSYYLDKFTKSFNALQPVPIIGRYMSYLSTTSTSLAKAARVWGFSAPVVQEKPNKFVYYNSRSMSAGDEPVVAHVLGLSVANATPMMKNTGNSYDELSFSYLLSKWWYLNQSNAWNDGVPTGTLIHTVPLSPGEYYKDYLGAFIPNGCAHLSALTYLARGFRYYKGSIKFKITFASTTFHSGRVLVVYTPGTVVPDDKAMGAYRKILDISENHSFEISFPFAATQAVSTSEPYGIVRFYVEETLRRPDTVSASVPFMVEVAGADDLRFMGWRGTKGSDGALWPPVPMRGIPYIPQSGCFVDTNPFDVSTPDMDDDLLHTGEVIRSLRPCMKADTRDAFLQLTTEGPSLDKYAYSSVFIPGVSSLAYSIPLRPSGVPVRAGAPNSLVTYSPLSARVAVGYYGYKGSKRLRVQANSDCCIVTNYSTTVANVATTGAVVDMYGRVQLVPNSANANLTSLLQAPYLSEFPFDTCEMAEDIEVSSTPASRLAFNTNLDSSTQMMSYSSVGEDFDCQFFLGWPIVSNFGIPRDWFPAPES